MTTLQEKMASLPASRRARIDARAHELIAEETSLRQLREAHQKTQAKIAKQLHIGQDSVSRLEKRSDMLISTLRDYVSALGGTMRLMVEFKDRPTIELKSIGALGTKASGPALPKSKRRKPVARGRKASKAA